MLGCKYRNISAHLCEHTHINAQICINKCINIHNIQVIHGVVIYFMSSIFRKSFCGEANTIVALIHRENRWEQQSGGSSSCSRSSASAQHQLSQIAAVQFSKTEKKKKNPRQHDLLLTDTDLPPQPVSCKLLP